MGKFELRVKSKNGPKVVDCLTPQNTVAELKNKLSEITGISTPTLLILQGFPPKAVDLSNGNVALQDSNIKFKEILIVEEKQPDNVQEEEIKATPRAHITDDSDFGNFPGILMKKVVPADDSCLFTSIGFVLNGIYYSFSKNIWSTPLLIHFFLFIYKIFKCLT